MGQKHKHHDVIVAWAAGAEIEYRVENDSQWSQSTNPQWQDWYEYRIKPEPPAKVYPVTGMTIDELRDVIRKSGQESSFLAIANAALRHAIDSGQLVETPAEYRKRIAKAESTLLKAGYIDNGGELWRPPIGRSPDQRAARDMAIAIAVRTACMYGRYTIPGEEGIDLAAIIASVKD